MIVTVLGMLALIGGVFVVILLAGVALFPGDVQREDPADLGRLDREDRLRFAPRPVRPGADGA